MIQFTEAALQHIQDMLMKTPDAKGFRLSIKKTGCSGFAYAPTLLNTIMENDLHFVIAGLNIYIDPQAESFIQNLTIDYQLITDSGLPQKKLIFINPLEKNRCGCGESFTIE